MPLYRVTVTNPLAETSRRVEVVAEDEDVAVLAAGIAKSETSTVEAISPLDLGTGIFAYFKAPNAADLADFYDGLMNCLEVGTVVSQALEIIAPQQSKPRFRGMIGQMVQDLRRGQSLSEAMSKHGSVFTPSTLALIRAGEASGDLPSVIRRLALGASRTNRLVGNIKKSLTYPAIVLVLMVLAVIFLNMTLIPRMAKVYANFNAELPWITQSVIWMSDVMNSQPLVWIAGIGLLWYVWNQRQAILRSAGFQAFTFWLPGLGPLLQLAVNARTFRVLGMLLHNGVRVGEAFEIASRVPGSPKMESALLSVRDRVIAGEELHIAFQRNQTALGTDGAKIISLLRLGGHTGNMGPILEKIADQAEEEVERRSAVIDKLIEPLLLGVLAVFVGGIVMAVYYPMFNLGRVILKH